MRNALVCLVAILGLGASQAGTRVNAAQAAPFLGDWTVSASSAALGAQTYQVHVADSKIGVYAIHRSFIAVPGARRGDKAPEHPAWRPSRRGRNSTACSGSPTRW